MSFRTNLLLQLAAFSSLTVFPLISMASAVCAADPTLEPIAADEPVPPAMFPPIPDRLNLGGAIATSPAASTSATAGSNAAVRPTYHQGYGHVPAGAYMQPQQRPAAPQASARPAPSAAARPGASGNDSYNANSGARPQLPELPTPVTVSQSTTQDLSLPDDEFSDYHQKKRRNNMAGNMLRGYMFGAAGMATGMGLGALRY